MSVKVLLPTALDELTGKTREAQVESSDVRGLLADLEKSFPGIKDRLYLAGSKELNRHVNIYVNQEDIRTLNDLETELKSGDEVSVVPSIAGGRDDKGCL